MSNFNGKNVIVTGGTSGIGSAITTAFLNAGAEVTAIYGGNDEKAESFKKSAPSNENLKTLKLDVSDYSAVESFFKTFGEQNEKLDILVNSAGIRRDGIVGMMKKEDWDAVINVNLTGSFNFCKFGVLQMMKKKYGRIINITSPAGKYGFEGQANYSASKSAQIALTKSLSKEVAKRKITVNAVSPGFIDTNFISDLNDETKKAYEKSVPLKRFGKPEEVAPAVLFLASDEASYITGSVLEVTGGL